MSAGKVMLGTDGNPLRSADGKIVLADDLYPMVPVFTVQRFYRAFLYDEGVCPASEIWEMVWNNAIDADYDGAYLSVDSTANGFCWQNVTQITIGANTIDWARVKGVYCDRTLLDMSVAGDTAGWNLKTTTAKNTGTIPTGTTIRDSWDVSNTIDMNTPVATTRVKWDIDGVEPTTLEFAEFIDISTCGQVGGAFYLVYSPSEAPYSNAQPRLIYNLATA